jgi:hypothetical protein
MPDSFAGYLRWMIRHSPLVDQREDGAISYCFFGIESSTHHHFFEEYPD